MKDITQKKLPKGWVKTPSGAQHKTRSAVVVVTMNGFWEVNYRQNSGQDQRYGKCDDMDAAMAFADAVAAGKHCGLSELEIADASNRRR